MTSLFFQKAARAISSSLRFMLCKLLDKIMTLLGCIFAKSIRLADSVMMITLIFAFFLFWCYFLYHCLLFACGMEHVGLAQHANYWFGMETQKYHNTSGCYKFSKCKVLPQSEMKSLERCNAVFIETPKDMSQMQKVGHFAHTCASTDHWCHGLDVSISNCAANNPIFLQNVIDISTKPCEYSRCYFIDDSLYGYYSTDGLSILFGDKTFSAINVLDDNRLQYQIIVPRLDIMKDREDFHNGVRELFRELFKYIRNGCKFEEEKK